MRSVIMSNLFLNKKINFIKASLRNIEIYLRLDSLATFFKLPTRILRRIIPPPIYYKHGVKRTYYSARCIWKLDLSDHVQREIAVNSLAFVRTIAKQVCREGAVILDVGANRGNFSIPLAKQLSNLSTVYAFEPHPKIYDDLNYNIQGNKIPRSNLISQQIALGSHCSSVIIKQPKSNSGATTAVEEVPNDELVVQFEVPVKTLDSLFENYEHEVAFIKIDVEGMDKDVLLGGRNIIRKYKPCIYIEVTQKTLFGISNFLVQEGYNLYLVKDDLKKIIELEEGSAISWGNILAIVPEQEQFLNKVLHK